MDNRSNILACALDLFAARGYEAVGVQEIAGAAGITKPTLYYYFGSKQGLLDALLLEHFEPLLREVRQAADYKHNLPVTLNRIVAACFAYARSQPAFYRLQLGLWFAPPESGAFATVIPFQRELHEIVEEMFRQAEADHGNMRGRSRRYATTFLGMINTYIGLAMNGYVELDDRVVADAVHQFSHGIYS